MKLMFTSMTNISSNNEVGKQLTKAVATITAETMADEILLYFLKCSPEILHIQFDETDALYCLKRGK